ncbi:MAG: hypothetical protein F4X20_00615 [Dehalococcoidia bacterium]|nr:hypothetical protein [Dehalococcoidia bacterium]
MKRKALVILSIAILAFAMVPAIGAGAAAGTVKIVTPDELANPSGRTGSAFEKLTSTEYVSDKTGTVASLEDAGGTLYAVIEDNDAAANRLTDYHAYFTTTIPTTAVGGGNPFNINPLDTEASGGLVAVAVTDTKGNFIGGTDSGGTATPAIPDAGDTDTRTDQQKKEGADLDDLVVGNRNRQNGVDAPDVVFQLGWYQAPTRDDPATEDDDESVAAEFTVTRTLRSATVFLDNGEGPDASIIYVSALNIPALSTDTPPEGTVAALRIAFASAGVNDLVDSDGDNLVSVTSTSGETINIAARERDLAKYDALTDDENVAKRSVNHADFSAEANESRDSGVFVGMFGVIRNGFKDAALDWEPVKGDATAGTVQQVTVVADGTDPIPANAVEAPADAATATAPFSYTVTVTLAGVDADDNTVVADNEIVASSIAVDVNTQDPARTDTDGTTSPTDPNDDPVAVSTTTTPPSGEDGAFNAATRQVTVTFVTDRAILSGDIFEVQYNIRPLNNNISHLLDAVDATGKADATDESAPFDKFCVESRPDSETEEEYDERCADVLKLSAALDAHRANLGLDAGDDASTLLGMIIGAEHGDTLSVRYSDASPRSTRSESAGVDFDGPTIGGLNPANGSYLDADNFTMVFDVTDPDSGIPEEAQDAGEAEIRAGVAYVVHEMLVGVGEDPGPIAATSDDGSEIDRDDEIADGERYEIDVDVSEAADAAEGDDNTDPVTVRVRVTINAYDLARNKAKPLVVNYVIDTIDPMLERAVTGVGLKSSNAVDGQYVLLENQANSIVLVFDDAIKGDEVRAQDINVVGTSVSTVTWLNNAGTNKISVGNTELSKMAGDLDYDAKTATTDKAGDVVKDLGLDRNDKGQDARHLLFLTLEADLGTGDRPTVEIDGGDLVDLADNTNRSDHEAKPIDRLSPSFTVALEQALSNSALEADITASEELDRTPRARIVRQSNDDAEEGPLTGELNRSLSLSTQTGNSWSVSADRKKLGLTATGGVQDGVYEIEITGTDDNANRVTVKKGKWELDTRANDGADPTRVGGNADKGIPQKIETNEVVFLSLEFKDEAGEYFNDSKKKVSLTALSLQSLAADAISATTKKIVTNPTIESTVDVDAGSAQTSDGVKHVIALSDLALGHYRLMVDYADEAGNTDDFGYVFTITAPAPEEVSVVPGWSLVSIPGTPQDTSIGGVLEGSSVTDVWSLNNETKVWEFARQDENGEWMGTLTQIVDGRGYFVRSTTFDPIKVLTVRFSPQRTPPQYTVTSGWNSIGYTPAGNENAISVDGYLSALGASGWGMIRTWNADATPPQYETYFSSGAMTADFPTGDGPDGEDAGSDGDSVADGVAKVEAGKGYLLFATRNGVIGG